MLNTKQYFIEFGSSIALYCIALFFSISFISSHPDSNINIWVSLLPIIPAILSTIAVIRAIRRLDELQQRIQLMSFAVSFAVVGLTTFTYGFLENAGLPSLPFVWIFPFMIATWGIATPIIAKTY